MFIRASELANFVGTHVIPFTNSRVVCPPGKIAPKGRPNLIVATPMRSGTHILIDLILNNLPDYKQTPLYVDLDQCVKQSRLGKDYLAQIKPDAGYVIKTHMPLNTPPDMAYAYDIAELIKNGYLVTIIRDRKKVCQSLGRWHRTDMASAEKIYGADYDLFWDYWNGYSQMTVDFDDLFQSDRMQPFIQKLALIGGVKPRETFMPPPSNVQKRRIYFNKILTRLMGGFAPCIDTTIHTLKS